MTEKAVEASAPTQPLAPPREAELPDAITVFVRAGERSALLRALKKRDPDRRMALLKALGIKPIEPGEAS